jgi:tetratricopeptide (TPR) repeat protein
MKFPFLLICLFFVTVMRSQEDTVKVAITLSPEEQATQDYNRGIEALQRQDFNTAANLFSRCLMIMSDFDKAFANRAIAFTFLKRYYEALSDINLAIKYNPGNSDYYFNKSLVYAGMNLPDSQHVELDRCLRRNGEHADAAYYKGLLAFEAKEYHNAIGYYNIAINTRKDFLNAWNDRASAKREKGDYDGAERDYLAALALDSTQAYVCNNLGSVYRLNKNYPKALSAYNRALQINPKYVLALLNRGSTYFEGNDLKLAQRDFESVLEIDSKSSFAYNNLASIALKNKDYRKAKDLSTRAIDLDSANGAAYYNRGIARQMLREEEGCCSDWRKAYKLGVSGAKSFINASCLH